MSDDRNDEDELGAFKGIMVAVGIVAALGVVVLAVTAPWWVR